MREIEFRGQEIDNSEWVYGDLVRIPKDLGGYNEPPSLELKTCITDKNSLSKNPIEVIPETVSQYTGRRDRNDKKIYEYNVIELFYSVSDKHQGIIEWDMRGFWRINWNKKASVYNFRLDIFSGDNFKIIGNKFENPELLEMENG